MPYKTKQQIIEKIKAAYENETQLGRNNKGMGCYSANNTVNNCGCVIGCLLPIELSDELDNEYSQYPIIEDLYYYWKRQLVKDETLTKLFTEVFTFEQYNLGFLIELQDIHDSSDTVEIMLERLGNVQV